MDETRWRKVQVIDESWQLEVRDPDYKAPLETKHLYGLEDGWRPKAVVWMWEYPSKTKRPWRANVGGPQDEPGLHHPRPGEEGSPACAGIDPSPRRRPTATPRLPRMRGDRP